MNIFVGTAGFSYKDWEGVVYPADLKKRKIHPLEYLAQFFDCCEINTSFYGHIRPNVGKSWCEKTAAVNPNLRRHPPGPFRVSVSWGAADEVWKEWLVNYASGKRRFIVFHKK